MKHKTFHISSRAGLIALSLFSFINFISCRDEYYGHEDPGTIPEDALNFTAFVKTDAKAATRDLTQEPVPVNSFNYGINFYIYMTCENGSEPELRTYGVPVGFQGQLTVKEDEENTQEKLNWKDPTSNHSFWSWTIPWAEPMIESDDPETDPETDPDIDTHLDDENTGSEIEGDSNNPTKPEYDYTPSIESLIFTLKDTSIETYNNKDSWKNGRVLERFIGTTAGPYNYKENGRDVPLQFRHLVSRIVIDSIVLTDMHGADHKDLQADIMFINMPDQFKFHPYPENGGAPYVETIKESANKNKALKFAITNKASEESVDTFYICPEIDFNQIEYKIAIRQSDLYTYEDRGEYWGSLANLPFEREPGTDYDNIGGNDDYILHAGEEMHLSLFMREFGGGGNSIIIQPWQDGGQSESVHHPHPGIYGTAEGRAMSGIGIDPSTNSDYREKWNDQYQISGDGATKDEPEYGMDPENPDVSNPFNDRDFGIFNIYGDIDMTSYSFYVGGGYLYNGNGYTVTLKEQASAMGMAYLGNMRDIYIRMERIEKDADGNTQYYNIYIDPNGRICIPDEDGNYVPSGLQMDGSYVRYNIQFQSLFDPKINPKSWSNTANGGSRSWATDTYIKDLPAYSPPSDDTSEDTPPSEEID